MKMFFCIPLFMESCVIYIHDNKEMTNLCSINANMEPDMQQEVNSTSQNIWHEVFVMMHVSE